MRAPDASTALLRPVMRASEMERTVPAPPDRSQKRVPYSQVVSWRRLAAEIGGVLLVCSWLLTAYSWWATDCHAVVRDAQSTVRAPPFVSLRAYNGLRWMVDDDAGTVRLADARTPEGQEALGFHMEWHGDAFCLRWLKTNRVVEAVAGPGAAAFTLRTRRYGCDEPAQRFTLNSRGALYNVGAASFINVREQWQLRAHGDTLPWKPLPYETHQTHVTLEELLPGRAAAFERGMLALLAELEMGGKAPPGRQPATTPAPSNSTRRAS